MDVKKTVKKIKDRILGCEKCDECNKTIEECDCDDCSCHDSSCKKAQKTEKKTEKSRCKCK